MSKTYSQSEKNKIERLLAENSALKKQLKEQQNKTYELQQLYDAISNSTFWKLTKPMRFALDVLKGKRHIAFFGRGIRFLKRNGFRRSCHLVYIMLSVMINPSRPFYSKNDLWSQRMTRFKRDVTFSILVPLYNTSETFLNDMIRSVLNQTYAKWELCLADGSDDEHGEVRRICERYAAKDKRIRYRKLKKTSASPATQMKV